MKYAVDLDGPCYEFARTVRYMLNHYRGKNLPDFEEFWTQWYPPEISAEDWSWVFSRGIDLGVFRYGHMTKDTRVGLQHLVAMGNEIIIITNRPKRAHRDTREWVEFFYKGIPHELHIVDNDTPKSTIEADVLIDDRPENVFDWAGAGRTALFWLAPWNSGTVIPPLVGSTYVVKGWKEVVAWDTKFGTSTQSESLRAASEEATTLAR